NALGPVASLDCGAKLMLLGREVHSREQELGDVGDRTLAAVEPGLPAGLIEQVGEDGEAGVESEKLRRAERAAHDREQRPVVAREREIGLGVAAVDREHDAHRTASWAASRSSSSSDSSYWPISGWVRSALFAVAGSRVTAASAVRRS